jgi:hypothetical protein
MSARSDGFGVRGPESAGRQSPGFRSNRRRKRGTPSAAVDHHNGMKFLTVILLTGLLYTACNVAYAIA